MITHSWSVSLVTPRTLLVVGTVLDALKLVRYATVRENESIIYPTALRGRLLISSTCTTCSSDKHEAEVGFNQRSYSICVMVRP